MRCAVLGDPIDHSLSPVIHRAAYAALGLDGWQYDAEQVPSGGLAGFLDGLDPTTWRGLSLTMPLKREAVPLLGSYDEWVGATGACNTVLLEPDGSRHGLNTDVTGALMVLGEHDVPMERAVVLGGGATATSMLLALAERGMRHATLVVRDRDRAVETVHAVAAHRSAPAVEVVADRRGRGAGRRRAGVDRARVRPGPRPDRGGRRRPSRLRRASTSPGRPRWPPRPSGPAGPCSAASTCWWRRPSTRWSP